MVKLNFKHRIIVSILLFTSILIDSCGKKEQPEGNLPDDIKVVNDFIYELTNDYYLWNKYVPGGINVNDYPDPYSLFNAMYYPTLDHWSFLTDNYQTILDELNGSRKTSGLKLQLFKYQASNDIFGVIEYVYDGSPGAIAGVKRGEILLKANGLTLNTTNYQDLLSTEVLQLGLGEIVNNTIVDKGKSVTITQTEMTINPVLQYKVIEKNGKKIGYLLYDQFIEEFFDDLKGVIEYFKAQNINELVLDLRYNPGGYVSTCTSLASMLAPSFTKGEIFLKQQWNDKLTTELTNQYGAESEWFIIKFPTPAVNLNLSRIYVLTSERTASASESLVNGLKPYMDILIGNKTTGKYTGANFFYDEEFHSHNWGLYLVINKISNVDGETDFVNGFTPNYSVLDDYYTPIGDETEPLLAKAISVITGSSAKSTLATKFNYKPFAKVFDNHFEKEGMMVLKHQSIKK